METSTFLVDVCLDGQREISYFQHKVTIMHDQPVWTASELAVLTNSTNSVAPPRAKEVTKAKGRGEQRG